MENDIMDDEPAATPPLTRLQYTIKYAPELINILLMGVTSCIIYFLTALACILELISQKELSVFIGLLTGSASGIANLALAPQMTRILLTRRLDVWLLTPLIFLTIGGLAASPLVAAILQANKDISNKLGIPMTKFDGLLGNIALLTNGVLFSIGCINLMSKGFALIMWKLFGNEEYMLDLMALYLKDRRSHKELEDFISQPKNFLKQQYSALNCFLSAVSLVPSVVYSYSSCASEIPDALTTGEHSVVSMKMLGVFGLVDGLNHYAKTPTGSKVIGTLTGTLLMNMYIGTTFRVMLRDIIFLFKAMLHCEFKQAFKILSYILFNALTCSTAVFQSIKGGVNQLLIFGTAISVYLINYSGLRDGFLTRLLPSLAKLSCCSIQSSEMVIPALKEKELTKTAFKRLEELRNDYQPSVSTSRKWCCCFGKNRDDETTELLAEERGETYAAA